MTNVNSWQGLIELCREGLLAEGYKVSATDDIDVIDPAFVPGTGTPEPGGLTMREATMIVRRLAVESNVVGFELFELNPLVDPTYVSALNANRIIREATRAWPCVKWG